MIFNISFRRVGGIRFLKVGRLCLSFCITADYKPIKPSLADWLGRVA